MGVPIVIVVRDPDYSNEYAVFDGEAETYDIDLGYADLDSTGEFYEWAESHLDSARRLQDDDGRPEAAAFIRSVVAQQAERHGDEIRIQRRRRDDRLVARWPSRWGSTVEEVEVSDDFAALFSPHHDLEGGPRA